MSGDSPSKSAASPIDLAREPDFSLGPLQVRPSTREVEADGKRDLLEPRVMQVLVALARAQGSVVSRDDLIESCWEGRIVGEDAINRAIGRLRKVSEGTNGAAFRIETVARVGYRLERAGEVNRAAPVSAPGATAAPLPSKSRHLAGAAIAGALVLAAVLGGAAWWWLGRAQWSIDAFRKIVATPVYEGDPALAPNGTMIAYSAGPAPFARHIFVRNLTSGEPIQLTSGPQDNDSHPVWSPGGDAVAFVRHREGIPCTLLIKPVPAGDERVVGRCVEDDFTALAWSPKGDALYFADRTKHNLARRVMRLDLASGTVTAITHPPDDIVGDHDPVPSPDGRRLFYVRLAKGVVTRFVLDLASGEQIVLPAVANPSAWIDNDTLIATAGGLNEPALWVVPLRGAPQKLAVNSEELGRISTGPNGQFAVETFRDQVVLASPPANASDTPHVLQATSGLSFWPEYSADGRLVFTYANPGGLFDVWVQRPGEAPHQISAFGADFISALRWSPDGKQLAFFGRIKGEHGIFTMNADGTGLRHLQQLTTTGMPAWTADGSGLILPMKDVRGWRLWRVPLSRPDRATPISGYGWFAVYARGDAIYALGGRGQEIWRVDGTPKFIATYRRRCTDNFGECHSWSVAGDTLIFADHSERNNPRIILHSLKDGSERSVLAPGLDNGDQIALDPTTGTLLYDYDGLGDSDIALFHLSKR